MGAGAPQAPSLMAGSSIATALILLRITAHRALARAISLAGQVAAAGGGAFGLAGGLAVEWTGSAATQSVLSSPAPARVTIRTSCKCRNCGLVTRNVPQVMAVANCHDRTHGRRFRSGGPAGGAKHFRLWMIRRKRLTIIPRQQARIVFGSVTSNVGGV